MSHVEDRLRMRFGITDLPPGKLKWLTLNYGEEVIQKGEGTIYKVDYGEQTLYPVVVNRDGTSEFIVTVLWTSYVEMFIRKKFRHNKKKLSKMLGKLRRKSGN